MAGLAVNLPRSPFRIQISEGARFWQDEPGSTREAPNPQQPQNDGPEATLPLGAAVLLALGLAAPLHAQERLAARADTGGVNGSGDGRPRGLVSREELIVDRLRQMGIESPDPAPRKPKDRADSLAWNRHRRAADAITGRKIVVSIYDRRLWLIDEDGDTVLSTRAGVGWRRHRAFGPRLRLLHPRGCAGAAEGRGAALEPARLAFYSLASACGSSRRWLDAGGRPPRGAPRRVDGYLADGEFTPIPQAESLFFDGILYIPPFGTQNRKIPEVLGHYKLDTGDGIMIHGTNDPLAIGFPATHGCIRLDDEPLEQLYNEVKVGTPSTSTEPKVDRTPWRPGGSMPAGASSFIPVARSACGVYHFTPPQFS